MKKKSILVVDDEKNIRLTVSQSLESLDVPVETAVNGEEALEKLRQQDFAVVLLDLKMSGLDGMDILRRIRADFPNIAVIIITAYGSIDRAVQSLKMGAVDFIQKPFSSGKIREIVKQALEADIPKVDSEKIKRQGQIQ